VKSESGFTGFSRKTGFDFLVLTFGLQILDSTVRDCPLAGRTGKSRTAFHYGVLGKNRSKRFFFLPP
jgi:hypothetical protein